MKYTVHEMPDGSVEVLQTDGGEEVLGRLTFRDLSQWFCFSEWCLERMHGDEYIDADHPGGKYLTGGSKRD